MKRFGVLTRFGPWGARLNDLRLSTRITIGFGIAFGLVVVLALAGMVALYAVNRDVGAFSTSSDASQAAADVAIGLRNMEVAVRDHLAENDPDSLAEAAERRDAVEARLAHLALVLTDAVDQAAVREAQAGLDAYWQGFERITALRAERARILGSKLESLVSDLRFHLNKLKDSGGIDSATVAGDTAIHVTRMLDHAIRLVERRDGADGERMRFELDAARDRMVEMNRYLWVPGTRQLITAITGMLDEAGRHLDRLDQLLVEEDALRADVLVPNAALVVTRAGELRQRTDAAAVALRDGLAQEATGYVATSLWIGGVVLLVGVVMAWFVTRSVSRPVDAMTHAVTALAQGHTDVAVPVIVRNDEIGGFARAVRALRSNAEEMERLRREAEAMQVRLIDEKERAEATNLAKSHFLVNMGHELHAPLNAIIAKSQSLMSELHRIGAGDLANDVESIQWSGEQLLGMLDSILDYAKIEAGSADVCIQNFDVGRLIAEVRERVQPLADLNGNALNVVGAAGLGGMTSDFAKVRQCLMNLLDNACKFTRGGQVTLAAERMDRNGQIWLRFVVADTGCGFSAAQAGRLFQPFEQGVNGSGRKPAGAGLGLTLLGHYCAMLGGDLEIASTPGLNTPGHGTRIVLWLPAVYEPPSADVRPLQMEGAARPFGPRPLLTVADGVS